MNGETTDAAPPGPPVEGTEAEAAEGKPLVRKPKRNGEAGEPAPPSTREFSASICPGPDEPISADLGAMALELESALQMPVWLLIQPMEADADDDYAILDESVRDGFFFARDALKKEGRIALVVDSPGGLARETYQIATLLRRHTGGFVAVVPRFAKSAATLLILGADGLYMGLDAELGPLDVQLRDPEREEQGSALDEVQALERLNSVALEQFDETLAMLRVRTRKKYSTLVPLALHHTAEMMAPLLHKIDTIHYAQQSRILAVAGDYAERLMRPRYGPRGAREISREFVNAYSEHGFVIDRDEADGLLGLSEPDAKAAAAIDALEAYLTKNTETAIGRVSEKGGTDGK